MSTVDAGALVRLVRLPSVVTVPGDVLVGVAWGDPDGTPGAARAGARVISSSLTYLAGMALNDWVDRKDDARDRPGRPIPAGEVAAAHAMILAVSLSLGALAVSARADRSVRPPSVPGLLLATVWAYDLQAKRTPAGPGTMALARTLDVLTGAGRSPRPAAAAAGLIGAHTLLLTTVSRREDDGASTALSLAALAGVAAVTATGGWLIVRGDDATRRRRGWSLSCLGLYAATMTKAGLAALRGGDATSVQRFVGSGVFANMPLQAALLSHRGQLRAAAGVLAAWPLGLRAARRVAVS